MSASGPKRTLDSGHGSARIAKSFRLDARELDTFAHSSILSAMSLPKETGGRERKHGAAAVDRRGLPPITR